MASTQQPTSFSSAGTLLGSNRNTSFEDDGTSSTSSDTSDTPSDGLDAAEAQKYLESILFSTKPPGPGSDPHDQPTTPQEPTTTTPTKGPQFRPPPTPDTTPSKHIFKRLYGGSVINHPSHLPPTPDNTPAKATFKRPCPAVEEYENEDEENEDEAPITPSTKRSRPSPSSTTTSTTTLRTRSLFRSSSTPKFSIAHKFPAPPSPSSSRPHSTKTHPSVKVSKLEMERVKESVLQQVDWNRVALDVAANRSGRVYRRVVRDVLGEWVEGAE